MAAKTEVKTETKQKLIDTALALLWTNSFGSVSVDDICRAADVRKGSFYHFFPSKVDLAVAAMNEFAEMSAPLMEAAFSREVSPRERVVRFADLIFTGQSDAASRYGQVCGCPCAALGSEMAGLEADIRNKFEEFARRHENYYLTLIADLIAEGTLPAETDTVAKAGEVYGYVVGQLTLARIHNDLEPLKRDLKPGLLRILGLPADTDNT